MGNNDSEARQASQKTKVPAVEGLFVMDWENPRLIGGKGVGRESYFFPKDLAGSDPASEDREEVLLSPQGKVWSYTTASYPPPPPFVVTEEPWEPFVLAAVELPEKIVVLGPMAEGTTLEDMQIGMKVKLGLSTLYEDEDHEYITWHWQHA